MEQSKFYQIKNVTEHEYTLVGCDGSVITCPIRDIDKSASAFTIEDATSGDVLATDAGNIFVFDGTVEDGKYPFAYCGIIRRRFESYDRKLPFTYNNIHPAIKEQRDLLFQKMKEAGYEWDADKKELKKIENKHPMLSDFFNAEYERGKADAIAEMQKSWSEEDERIIDGLISICDEAQDDIPRLSVRFYHVEALKNWLTSLKYRVQPKQEWSDDDESMFRKAIITIDNVRMDTDFQEYYQGICDWLQSLKDRVQPQNTWKPSEGQLECLGYAIEKARKDWTPLTNNRIYLTLKALKEQLEKL